MICRSELKRIQSHNDYPSISLLAPTHRTAPANKRDRIVVKNLAADGLKRLHGEFKKREVAPLVQNLNKLIDKVDWEHMHWTVSLSLRERTWRRRFTFPSG